MNVRDDRDGSMRLILQLATGSLRAIVLAIRNLYT